MGQVVVLFPTRDRERPAPYLDDWIHDGLAVLALVLGAAAFVIGATLVAMVIWTL